MFSLFYSLPATYWDSVYASQTAPVFSRRYNIPAIAWGSLVLRHSPALRCRVPCSRMKDLRLKTPGDSLVERDARITPTFCSLFQQPNSSRTSVE